MKFSRFFLAFMIGQVPNLLRNILLIWTSTKETDEVRGEKDAKDLYVAGSKDDVSRMLREAKMYTPSMEGMLPERRANTIHRTYASHVFRRLISTLFPLAEASIIGYLMYVGEAEPLTRAGNCQKNVSVHCHKNLVD